MIVESKPLPLFSLVYHIEYSLIQSCTALVLLLFLRKEWKAQPHSMLMVALAVCGVVLFAALHILSARTGILAFWLGLAAAVIFNRERQIKRWKLITAAILVVALAFAVPSIRNRISNSYQDFKAVVNRTDLNHKSLGQRWVAWGTGMQVIQKAPLMGHGLGNVHRAMKSAYAAESGGLDADNQINPHNQYIEVGVQSGILGIALLLVFYVLGIWKGINDKNSYQISILVALAAAMLFESILERQSGVLVVLVFVGFWCNWGTKDAE
ncbi:MAG: O-antigen ligase family protein [Bacteroidia bacterium]|nr:O-antigen ligase family protein [Bacteroidia bacterium]